MPAPTEGRPRRFFGRDDELETLAGLFAADGPDVVSVSGVPGVGKSALLRAFARLGSDRGVEVGIVDCRTVEPTASAFEAAVQDLGLSTAADGRAVLCLDHYEHFLLLDTWLRQRFLPDIEGGLRLLVAGRDPLGVGWSTSGIRTRALKLDVLDDDGARALLAGAGVEGPAADPILRFTKGHPLALELAASGSDTGNALDGLAPPEVVHALTRYFLDHVEDPITREALEAAATVRRVTQPIITEMLADSAQPGVYEQLAALPLVEVRNDGLSLHPTVHETVASWLRAADPSRFITYRRRAWRALERDGRSIGIRDLWRYTADVIFLIDDPIVREAFFPSASQTYAVEPARPADHGAIGEITELHDGAEERGVIEGWLESAPQGFHVVRDGSGTVQGYYFMIDPVTVPAEALQRDPVTRAWQADLPGSLRGGHKRVLFLRRWLAREWGDVPSPIQGASWLDVKRTYLEGRPLLRRVYLAVSDLGPYLEAAAKLGFVPACTEDGLGFPSAMLDFGPGSVDAWLGRLVRDSLGLREEVALDVDRHALTLGADVVQLTPRELAVARVLLEAGGGVVSRDTLLERAWEGGEMVGSNVVDVLVRGLRKKLGKHAELIQTVRGAGYRWGGRT